MVAKCSNPGDFLGPLNAREIARNRRVFFVFKA